MEAFPTWVPPAAGGEAKDDEEVELSEEAAAKRKLMSHEIEALRKKLRILIEHNGNAPDLEKRLGVTFRTLYPMASFLGGEAGARGVLRGFRGALRHRQRLKGALRCPQGGDRTSEPGQVGREVLRRSFFGPETNRFPSISQDF